MGELVLGKYAEKLAANYLVSIGYVVVDVNRANKRGYRIGEIDIIAKDKKGQLVFVEVKARRGKNGQVVPEESVTQYKIKKIIKVANDYLRENCLQECDWRIDAISIIFDINQRKAHLKHIKYIRL